MANQAPLRKPDWIRTGIPAGAAWRKVSSALSSRGLHTVCDEARCPNKAECWGCGTATFMVMGDVCTRGCRFCAVATAREGRPLRAAEPAELAAAAAELGLRYVVVTSVDRDDLGDGGAAHFAACVRALKALDPAPKVEVLVPDYRGEALALVAAAGPDVLAHNVETVRRLQGVRDARAGFDSSLAVLREAKARGVDVTKSSLMVGLGEGRDEVLAAMDELRGVGVDVLVVGQYLRPSPRQVPVVEYVEPAAFADYRREGLARGFSEVVAAPFARTSYHALAAWEGAAGRAGEPS